MNNFATRSLTAIGFTIAMVGSALLGQFVFSALMFVVVILGMKEFLFLNSRNNNRPAMVFTIILGVLVYVLLAANALGLLKQEFLLLIVPVMFLFFFVELWRAKEQPFVNIGLSITAIIYVAVPLGLLIYFFIQDGQSNLQKAGIVLGYLLILWLNDTGAYVVGSLIGKHKLFERISPSKSWEGSIGGAIFALATGWAVSLLFTSISLTDWLLIALITVAGGSLGDLVESMMKRSLGVKDSGTILPGHGGILDRFDAVLLSAPFVFIYLTYFCHKFL